MYAIVAPFPWWTRFCTSSEQGVARSIRTLGSSCSLTREALSCFFQQPEVKNLVVNFAAERLPIGTSLCPCLNTLLVGKVVTNMDGVAGNGVPSACWL